MSGINILVGSAQRQVRYGLVARIFHWTIVALLGAQFAVAWLMPEIHRTTRPEGLIAVHLSLGILILIVALFRIVWRLAHRVAFEEKRGLSHYFANALHVLLYILLLALPLLGWANSSSRGWSISLFGIIPLPMLVAKGSPAGHAMGDLHQVAAYVLLGAIGLHVIAALIHRFWLRDNVMDRMLLGSDATESRIGGRSK